MMTYIQLTVSYGKVYRSLEGVTYGPIKPTRCYLAYIGIEDFPDAVIHIGPPLQTQPAKGKLLSSAQGGPRMLKITRGQ